MSSFASETRATVLVLNVTEIADQQDDTKHETKRANDQKRYVFRVVVLCVSRAHEIGSDGQEQEYTNCDQYPADQNERPVEPSRVSDVIQGAIDQAIGGL